MTFRNVKGKLRFETPRLKDLNREHTERDPSDGRTADGRFATGNRAASEQGAKSLIRKALGRNADPEMVRESLRLYHSLLKALPFDGPNVRVLTAGQCRHTVLATRFADEAIKAGLTSAQGMKLAEMSRSHDLAAQRLAVTAYDLAVREAASAKEEDRWR